jgi:hypothetical protein
VPPAFKHTTQIERVAALEVIVSNIEKSHQSMEEKLDRLLVLRNQGVGAFWLASALLGTGIIGFCLEIIAWLKPS